MAATLESARALVELPQWAPSAHGELVNEIGEYVDVVIEHLRTTMKSAASTCSSAEMAKICDVVLTLQQLRADQQQILAAERIRMLTSVRHGTDFFAGRYDPASVFEHAAEVACKVSGLDRSMVFRYDAGYLHAAATYFSGNRNWATECQRQAEQTPIKIVPGVLESEVVRRRLPALITDPINDPQAFQPITGLIRTRSYVAAPIFVNGKVEGTLHLDAYYSDRDTDSFDRDVAADLAASVGHALERALLAQQLQEQHVRLNELARCTENSLRHITASSLPLMPPLQLAQQVERQATAQAPPTPNHHVLQSLTRREMEVLQLMSTGATNAEIASQLVVADGTAKTHVKRILRKLDARNRGQAVATYQRLLHQETRRAP
ncbi:LuxR C-terminal-related transcriptional regulator [Rhodococcus zopfii]|uniref:LuxR C-terminal-related transcriptional regulator n=1 Tax=Rhodococcus zopfii TaxID=43772 RepID=UPI000A7B4EB9|nr:LuxR C-terminal-related transcriptional regulator [Rhodococcus zopfii]